MLNHIRELMKKEEKALFDGLRCAMPFSNIDEKWEIILCLHILFSNWKHYSLWYGLFCCSKYSLHACQNIRTYMWIGVTSWKKASCVIEYGDGFDARLIRVYLARITNHCEIVFFFFFIIENRESEMKGIRNILRMLMPFFKWQTTSM